MGILANLANMLQYVPTYSLYTYVINCYYMFIILYIHTHDYTYLNKEWISIMIFKYKHNMFCIINILYTYLNLMPMFTKSGTPPRSRVESHSRWPISLSLLHDMTQSTLVPSFSAASKCRNHQLLRSKFGSLRPPKIIHGFLVFLFHPFCKFPTSIHISG